MSLDLIGSNLREIYVAVHDPDASDVELVPNAMGTRVYHVREGWGRIWSWFFNIVCFFIGDDFKKEKLQEAMVKTKKVFQDELSSIEKHIDTYQTHLKNRIEGLNINEDTVHEARNSIAAWNQELVVFSDFAESKTNSKLTGLFEQFFSLKEKDDLPFSCAKYETSLKKIQKIIDFEGISERSLPIPQLKKLATEEELDEADTKQLKSWIKKINRNQEIDVQTIHKALATCIDFFSSNQHSPDLVTLELGLYDRDCRIFKQDDPEHLKRRKAINEGDSISCNGNPIKLGRKLDIKFSKLDNHVVFASVDNANEVVVIGINQSILGIEKLMVKKTGGGTYFAEYIEVDSEGFCARVERLKTPLEGIKWTSDKTINQADKDTANPIVNLIKYWMANKIILQNMQLKNFSFNASGVLKYTKYNCPAEIDYIVLEDFVFDCANENLAVFAYLMEQSGLSKLSHQELYKQNVMDALDGKEREETLASLILIDDPKVCKRANKLYEDVNTLKEKCCQTIYEKYEIVEEDELIACVGKKFQDFYLKSKSGCKLWPSITDVVIEKVIKSMHLSIRADLS